MSDTTKFDDGGPAFPVPTIDGPDLKVSYPPHVRGMSLHDWYVGQLAGTVLAAVNTAGPDSGITGDNLPSVAATLTHQYAAALIAEKRRIEGASK